MSFIDTVRGGFLPVVPDEKAMDLNPAMPVMRRIDARMLERRRDPFKNGDALDYTDEGLPSYLWMLAARGSRTSVHEA